MDRAVQARITYWAGTWHPHSEGISKEVTRLRHALAPRAPVVAFSPGNESTISWRDRVLTLSPRHALIFRALAPVIESSGRISHVFGGLDSWYLLRSVGRRPTVLTVVTDGPRLEERLYRGVQRYVAESPALARSLARKGVPEDRIRLIYPGTDLSEFSPTPPPAGRFRLLFASWPEDPDQLEKRGVLLLKELARRCADLDVVLLTREWGDYAGAMRVLHEGGLPANVHVERLDGRSMSQVFASVHATTALFATGSGKSCPNSVIEGLACGRPAVISRDSGIAETIQQWNAGVAVPREIDDALEGVARLRANWSEASGNARRLAEQGFSEQAFVRSYLELYRELLP